jgi:hypothetical protein
VPAIEADVAACGRPWCRSGVTIVWDRAVPQARSRHGGAEEAGRKLAEGLSRLSVRGPENLWGQVLEPLWEDSEFGLSRSVGAAESRPLLAVVPLRAVPGAEILARLERAYALRDALDPAWAARPLELVHHGGRPTLLLEDPGGELLARLVGQPWEIAAFLRVAIGLAVAADKRHEAD